MKKEKYCFVDHIKIIKCISILFYLELSNLNNVENNFKEIINTINILLNILLKTIFKLKKMRNK